MGVQLIPNFTIVLPPSQSDRIEIYLRSIWEIIQKMNIDVTALLKEVADSTTVEKSALTFIQTVAANQAALSVQLAAAIAANDPVALAAAQKSIDDSVTTLKANDAELAAAIANPPAPPPVV